MSKPHLAIQNQAVKYAQKDIDGKDINQYDYVSVEMDLVITTDIEYNLTLSGLYIDLKNNYKKALNIDREPVGDIPFDKVFPWIMHIMNHQPSIAYLSSDSIGTIPVATYYNDEDGELRIFKLSGETILEDIHLIHDNVDTASVRINPLTDDIDIFEV